MKAEKLPSGRWRAKLFLGTVDGKKVFKSFTADTKRQAEMDAALYMHTSPNNDASGTVQDLVEKYIEAKKAVLSPSTVRSYNTIKKKIQGTPLGKAKIEKVKSVQVQLWISEYSKTHSPKTVKNAAGLISATLGLFAPDTKIIYHLPQQEKKDLYTPTDEDIKAVINIFAKRGDTDMLLAIYLASCSSLRRGEICALQCEDIDRAAKTASISKSMVYTGSSWEVKAPKTTTSKRVVPVPDKVLDLLPKSGPVVNLTPAALTDRWMRAVRSCHGKIFRFHDLRHYWATVMAYNTDIPKHIVKEIGGWSASSATMERVYVGTIEAENKKQMEKISSVFNAKL